MRADEVSETVRAMREWLGTNQGQNLQDATLSAALKKEGERAGWARRLMHQLFPGQLMGSGLPPNPPAPRRALPLEVMMMRGRLRVAAPITCLLLAATGCLASMGEVPRVSVLPASTVQKHGGPVVLRCEVEPPGTNVTWRHNGEELSTVSATLGIHVSRGTLLIAALRHDTVGRYQCVAHLPAGAVASVPAPVTLANLQDFKPDGQHVIEVGEGNTAIIACHLPESHPKAQARYSVKQEWLEASRDNYLIMPSGNLQIVNASHEDEGTYKCAAYNPVTQEVKTSGSSDRLRVRRASAEAARIIYPREAQTITVTRGQSLVLECVASGAPPPRVTWAKDGSSVGGYNNTRFLLSNLLIDAATERDSGTYRCMADNGVGEPGVAVVLYRVQVFEPPVVTVELSRQVVPWGQSARLACVVRGNPPPSMLWLHNAVPLAPSQRLNLAGGTLWLARVGPLDDGLYQCMAENEVGSAQAMVQLRTARPGSTFALQRDVGVGWTMPPTTPSMPPDQVPSGTASLPQPRPTVLTASGPCPLGEGQAVPAEAPVILSSPRTPKTDSYELVWRPRNDGGNRAPVLFYVVKHRKAANSSGNWTVSEIHGHQHRLPLTRLDPGSLYEVEVAAHNCAGEGQTAMVTFRTAPEAPDRPTISTASETSVYVTWIPRGNGGFPIQSFRVEARKLKKVGDWVPASSAIPPSRLSVEIAGLEKGTSYKFRVRAMNVLGESRPSAASRPYLVSGSGSRGYERPVAGPHITFTEAVNETTIMLKWMYIPASNNHTPIHGFFIYYRPTDSDNDSDYKKDVVEGDRYWHSISQLQPETSYDIKMQCFNEGGESDFSNVMICETKARKHPVLPGRPPPPTLALPKQLPPFAIVARSSDLPYLIVGVVLGSVVLLIVAFIPFCLWRAWSKQKHTTDLGCPGPSLLTASCQYTLVPLRAITPSRASSLPRSGGCPATDPRDYSRAHLKQMAPCTGGENPEALCLPSGPTLARLAHCPLSVQPPLSGLKAGPLGSELGPGPAPLSPHDPRTDTFESSPFPDPGSPAPTHQLPGVQGEGHWHQEPAKADSEDPRSEALWDALFLPAPACGQGLAPVEQVESCRPPRDPGPQLTPHRAGLRSQQPTPPTGLGGSWLP
ncbi:brother of CDO isoform X3 [Tachyglossus aculeatus]|uniref:brother of CDO isoform X3 n=1 Tax=Tachyglossus aculeatus TaxID=9261 RepID=UPI0018F29DB5|nr:brother of CDO isoform X3 [Tachyglossus aculeatus]